MTYPCAHCGTPCPPHSHQGRPRKWCSDDCRIAYARANGWGATRTMACASCGQPMWKSGTSLPEGQATCLPCRRKNKTEPKRYEPELRFCKICSRPFDTKQPSQVYCSADCRNSRRGWSRAKPSSMSRGYGTAHQQERRKWKPIVEAGEATCCLCHYPIDPGTPWHLDHTPDRSAYRGVAHAACNVRDGAKRANWRSRQRGAGSWTQTRRAG